MAEGIENTQEQKVILKKAKPESASAAAAQTQAPPPPEQKTVRMVVRRKVKPVAHPPANAGEAHASAGNANPAQSGDRPAGGQKKQPVASSAPAALPAQLKKIPEAAPKRNLRGSSKTVRTGVCKSTVMSVMIKTAMTGR